MIRLAETISPASGMHGESAILSCGLMAKRLGCSGLRKPERENSVVGDGVEDGNG